MINVFGLKLVIVLKFRLARRKFDIFVSASDAMYFFASTRNCMVLLCFFLLQFLCWIPNYGGVFKNWQ